MSGRLAINIGNTRIACGFFQNGELRDVRYHFIADLETAGRELALFASERQVRAAAICSVVPLAEQALARDLQRKDAVKLFTITDESQTLLSGLYKGLGADRIANAAGAYKLYAREAPAIVLDFGTATTLTAVSQAGKFLGGWITLGLGNTLAALHQSIALLPDLQDKLSEAHVKGLGLNTKDAITGGCLHAHVGAIEAWLKSAKKEIGSNSVVVATGGYSSLLQPLCSQIDKLDPQLTIKGIDFIAEAAMGPVDRV